jgi:hypothetical protein
VGRPVSEDEIMRRLSSYNPRSRRHREVRSDGWSSWGCIPIRDAIEVRADALGDFPPIVETVLPELGAHIDLERLVAAVQTIIASRRLEIIENEADGDMAGLLFPAEFAALVAAAYAARAHDPS